MEVKGSSAKGPSEIVSAWDRRCRERGVARSLCAGQDALFLVSAVTEALSDPRPSAELGRAARSWGASCSPVQAVSCLAALADVMAELDAGDLAGTAGRRVFDQLAREAVDAASASLRAEARTDALTGCANRLALSEELGRAVSRAERSGLELSVAMVDLDGLKHINDSRGHDAGDEALLRLVGGLRLMLRGADSVYRIGGDEFVVLAPFTDAPGARAMLERAAKATAVSFSWGVASLSEAGPEVATKPDILVSMADKDLYASRYGRSVRFARRRDRAARAGATPGRYGRYATRVALAGAAVVLVAGGTLAAVTLTASPHATPGRLAAAGRPASSPAASHPRAGAATSPHHQVGEKLPAPAESATGRGAGQRGQVGLTRSPSSSPPSASPTRPGGPATGTLTAAEVHETGTSRSGETQKPRPSEASQPASRPTRMVPTEPGAGGSTPLARRAARLVPRRPAAGLRARSAAATQTRPAHHGGCHSGHERPRLKGKSDTVSHDRREVSRPTSRRLHHRQSHHRRNRRSRRLRSRR